MNRHYDGKGFGTPDAWRGITLSPAPRNRVVHRHALTWKAKDRHNAVAVIALVIRRLAWHKGERATARIMPRCLGPGVRGFAFLDKGGVRFLCVVLGAPGHAESHHFVAKCGFQVVLLAVLQDAL